MKSNSSPGIAPKTGVGEGAPFNVENFERMGVTRAWREYDGVLTWGKGQCLAILDDGCDITQPQWQVEMPWGRKVAATWNSIDGNEDCAHVPPGYHGTTVGNPSSYLCEGLRGVAYNNHVAHVRAVTVVHLKQDESASLAAALQWVIDRREELNITAVNLSPADDQSHREPVPTAIDEKLERLRELGIWVSAPCGNNHFTDGICWPACQPACFAIGATRPERREVYLNRWSNVDLVVPAAATSSSNAYAAACSMILREAVETSGYDWRAHANTLPGALMALFQETGTPVHDLETGFDFREMNLYAAVKRVMGGQ